jgi:D-arabinose 1-dehydrogenase-like Zn-dependent alcohol dehydrogenase
MRRGPQAAHHSRLHRRHAQGPAALQFAAEGKVKATITTRPLDAVNEVFEGLKRGEVQGRIVLDLSST